MYDYSFGKLGREGVLEMGVVMWFAKGGISSCFGMPE